MNAKTIDTIAAGLQRIHQGRLVEIRALGLGRNFKGVASGYFYDYAKAAEAAANLEDKGAEGIYQTLNEIHEGCYARSPEIITENPRYTTTDADILRRRWRLIDVDPVRPSGVSSSDAELAEAKLIIDRIVKLDIPWESYYIKALSGNGYHLLLPDGGTTVESLKADLENLDNVYGEPAIAHVDRTVFNMARITKLYGTLARKGHETDDRPHRRSKILQAKSK